MTTRATLWQFCWTALIGAAIFAQLAYGAEAGLTTKDIRIRDPFIHADEANETYYMYAQSANREGSDFLGVEVYTSKDLKHWTQPKPVLTLPEDTGIKWVWAPEMHAYQGQYYLFVTLTYEATLPIEKPVDSYSWPPMHRRGTHVYHAESPLGPFEPFKQTSHTPEDKMALDGTLYVENGTPYMVYCHEWVELVDGTMEYVQLKDDLSDTVGKPRVLFKATDAPRARTDPNAGKITDGCFLYKSPKSGKLYMIWSTFIPGHDYCVVLTHSESGGIEGPWEEHKLLYTENGGHGILFRTFEGTMLMALHQPNETDKERLRLFGIAEDNGTLKVAGEYHPGR